MTIERFPCAPRSALGSLLIGGLATVAVATAQNAEPDADAAQARVVVEAFPELLPDWAADTQEPPAPALLDHARALAAPGVGHELLPLTQAEIDEADVRAQARSGHIRPGPARLGLVRPVGALPLRIPDDCEVNEPPVDGEGRWLLAIRSPGAFEVRAHLSAVELGRSTLVLYSLSEEGLTVRGPFRGRGPDGDGDFWPASLPGDQLFIEIRGPDVPRAEIGEIVHCDQDVRRLNKNHTDNPEPCELDVMCFGTPPINVAARQAVGTMRFVSGGQLAACSGTLIVDGDPETFMPYFLTANHCVDETVNLDTLEVYWNYQKTPCGAANCPYDSCLGNSPTLANPSVGGYLLATSGAITGNDASFLRLKGGLPTGVGFAGWTTNEEAGTVGIHHPGGSWKRAFFGKYESTSIACGAECGCFTPANYAFYSDVNGIVEKGSSGSAMFTTAGQVIGQLFGTCSLCPDTLDCWHTGDWCTQYGEWAQTYPQAQYWLQLGGTIWVDAANLTAPWNGLQSSPYFSVTSGYNAAWDGAQIKIVAGNYAQNLTMSKSITIKAVGGLVRIGSQ